MERYLHEERGEEEEDAHEDAVAVEDLGADGARMQRVGRHASA